MSLQLDLADRDPSTPICNQARNKVGLVSFGILCILTGVRGLQELAYRVFNPGGSLVNFLLAPACATEKITLWVDLLDLTSGSGSDEFPFMMACLITHSKDKG